MNIRQLQCHLRKKIEQTIFKSINNITFAVPNGRMAEWLNAPVLKTGVPERVSGVRIPILPQKAVAD